MAKRSGITRGQSLTFSDYFKLFSDVEEVLAGFGYSFQIADHPLPKAILAADRSADLRQRIEESLPFLLPANETERREFLISPVLLEVVRLTHAKIRAEYPLEVNDQLKGTLDYFLRSHTSLLVIEAKNGDLTRGFLQLAVELVALDKWLDKSSPVLHGAVSLGDIWRFGVLQRRRKLVIQDVKLFRVPEDLTELFAVLTGILSPPRPLKTFAKKSGKK